MPQGRSLLLEPDLLLDPEAAEPAAGALLVEDGRIRARLDPAEGPPDAQRVRRPGLRLAPGFLDLHYHGGLVFAPPTELAARLAEEGAALLRQGTTGFLATTMAWPAPELMTRVSALVEAVTRTGTGAVAAHPLGLHLEGPWIRTEAAGAQPRGGIRAYDAREGREVLSRAEGCVRMVTLAPEIPGSAELQSELVRRGIVAALGHSLADEACVMSSVERGMTHVTHLFNAMSGLHHRQLGVAGAALVDDRLSCDLICDGVHVHPRVVRLAARAKGERLLLITDRLQPPAGAGSAGFGAGAVSERDGAWRLADGTLAGSSLGLDRALRNAQAFGALSELQAVAACTLRPARLLGLEAERGTLRPGARADFALLDAEGRVQETWLGGRPVF